MIFSSVIFSDVFVGRMERGFNCRGTDLTQLTKEGFNHLYNSKMPLLHLSDKKEYFLECFSSSDEWACTVFKVSTNVK